MSIEQKIEALTKAIEENTAVHLGRPTVASRDTLAKTEKPVQAKIAPDKTAKLVAPTYDDVKRPFLALVAKSRDAALATLKPFGLDNLKNAKPEQYKDILAAVTKALADAEAAA